MNCAGFRESVWARIDGQDPSPPPGPVVAHARCCVACREYAARAAGLDDMLRGSLRETAAAPSLAPRILGKIRALEARPEPAHSGLFFVLALAAAAWRLAWPRGGEALLSPFAEAFRLTGYELAFLNGAAAPPLALTLGTLGLAGLLWLSAMQGVMSHERGRRHG